MIIHGWRVAACQLRLPKMLPPPARAVKRWRGVIRISVGERDHFGDREAIARVRGRRSAARNVRAKLQGTCRKRCEALAWDSLPRFW